MYEAERRELYNIVYSKLNVDLSHGHTHEYKLQEIFCSDDLAILNAFGKFIKNALQKREYTICHILSPHYI